MNNSFQENRKGNKMRKSRGETGFTRRSFPIKNSENIVDKRSLYE